MDEKELKDFALKTNARLCLLEMHRDELQHTTEWHQRWLKNIDEDRVAIHADLKRVHRVLVALIRWIGVLLLVQIAIGVALYLKW